jgi:mRNA-degrading endonuclease toxin of MazEF toxin-antitoxin module
MQFTRDKHSHRTIASTIASRTMQPHKPKLTLELAIRHADKNFNIISSSLLEKIKTPDPQANTTKTVELNKDNGLRTLR